MKNDLFGPSELPEPAPEPRERGPSHLRWRQIFSPQATSLLLVVAVLLLSYITFQTKQAASGAKQQTIVNRTIIQQQNGAAAQARQQAIDAAANSERLARESVARLLASEKLQNQAMNSQDKAYQTELLAAIASLEALIRQLDAQDRQREDYPSPTPRPGPSATPSPTCKPLPVLQCNAP